jgi:outer membrane protein OmpA-like peptidoglycan-associated protein
VWGEPLLYCDQQDCEWCNDDCLRIELSESATGTFFDSGSAKLNGDSRELLVTLAQELGKLPNKLSIEGHTDSQPYSASANYGNWELSSDRTNAARRLMQGNGIRADQVTQVRGFADQQLRKPEAPLDSLQSPHFAHPMKGDVKNRDDDEDTKAQSESDKLTRSTNRPLPLKSHLQKSKKPSLLIFTLS